MKRIGIIGGMGALASCDLYAKIISLTTASRDQEHIPLLIDNNTKVPDRTEFILHGGEDPFLELKDSTLRLKNGGCQSIAIACNTAHFWAKRLKKECDVEILHIAKIAVNSILKNYPNAKNVAVIATTGTKKAKIYDEILVQNGLNSVEIDEKISRNIMECIYSGVKAGKTKDYITLFDDSILAIEADIFIAACTEIPVLLEHSTINVDFIDATYELAKFIVQYSKGQVKYTDIER